MSHVIVYSALLRETRQAIELIGDKIEQFTCCAAAKRWESILSSARKVTCKRRYAYYTCMYTRPLTSHVYQLFSRVSPWIIHRRFSYKFGRSGARNLFIFVSTRESRISLSRVPGKKKLLFTCSSIIFVAFTSYTPIVGTSM